MPTYPTQELMARFPCPNPRHEESWASDPVETFAWKLLPHPLDESMPRVELREAGGTDSYGDCAPESALVEARIEANERGHAIDIWDMISDSRIATVQSDQVGMILDPAQIRLDDAAAGLAALAPDPRDEAMAWSCATCGARPGGMCLLEYPDAAAAIAAHALEPVLVTRAVAAKMAKQARTPKPAPQMRPVAPRQPAPPPRAAVARPSRPSTLPSAPSQPAGDVVRLPSDSGSSPRDILGNRLMVGLIRERGAAGFTLAELRDVSGFASTPPASWLATLSRRNGFAVAAMPAASGRRFALAQEA